MGFSLAWIVVDGKSAEEVCTALSLQKTGVREKIPEAPFTGAYLPSGSYLVVANHGLTHFHDTLLEHLSLDSEIITCAVEEHVMYSSAAGWIDGRKIWEIRHDAQVGVEHLETDGSLPPVFDAVYDRLRLEQETHGGQKSNTDFIFDVPVEIAESITGYRYDKIMLDDAGFEVLAQISGSTTVKRDKQSWWIKRRSTKADEMLDQVRTTNCSRVLNWQGYETKHERSVQNSFAQNARGLC